MPQVTIKEKGHLVFGLSVCAWMCTKNFNIGLVGRALNRGSYMSAHVLLNLLNELGKRDKIRGLLAFYLFFAMSLINSIIQEHEC